MSLGSIWRCGTTCSWVPLPTTTRTRTITNDRRIDGRICGRIEKSSTAIRLEQNSKNNKSNKKNNNDKDDDDDGTHREREREKVMSRLTAAYPLPRRRQHRCLAQPRGINRLSLSLPFSHPRVEHIPINYNNLDDHNGHNERIDRRVDGMIGSVVQPSVLNIRTASPSTTTKTIDGSMEGSVGGSKRVPQPSVLNNTASRTT